MLNMTEETKDFLSKNLSDALTSDDIGEVLRMLYRLINKKGFAPPHYDSYNDFGREAQKAYDDLYYSN